MAGTFAPADLLEACRRRPGWSRVEATGHLDRGAVNRLLQTSIAGLVTFHPQPNHMTAQPNKLFEYMSAGLPLIASSFPMWRELVSSIDCGLVVDPLNPIQIARAIDRLVDHPNEAERMGRNGRDAILERFNWSREESALLELYRRLG
jgi:glycosyltransferase involved in cell wall biosynthesis